MKYLRFISFFLIALTTLTAQAQDWQLVMDLMISNEGKKLPGAQVSVIQNGKMLNTYTADSKGQVDVPVPSNGLYILKISSNNLVSKKLEIDTRNVNPEEVGKGDILYRADVELFQNIEGLDLSILDEPIGQIWYDDKFGGFTYNKEYTLKKQAALTKLKDDYLKKKEQEAKKLAENKKLFDEAIKKGDKAFKLESWEEAKQFYEQAQSLDPTNTYPSFQLGEIATKLINLSANQEKYDAAIKMADAALASKKYKDALEQYKRAQGYKPEDKYAAGKIVEVQELAVQSAKVEQSYLAAIEKGDKALVVNDVETAKAAFTEAQKLKPEESYPAGKLAEIAGMQQQAKQKEEEYKNAIASAEKALTAKDYAAAKTSFQQASKVKPSEAYPKTKIAEIDAVLAENAKKEQEYVAAISTADNALQAKKYEDAIAAYQKASSIKPSEEYPKGKVKEINGFLAANAEKEKQYADAIKAADDAFAKNELGVAKESYQKALGIKSSESYPQQKIAQIDQTLAELKAKDEKYQTAISAADKAYAAKDLKAAKGFYENALSAKPNESYPQKKIEEIDNSLVQQEELEKNYNAAITSADDAFAGGDLPLAKKFYEEALKYKASEKYPSNKISEINSTLAAAEKKEEKYKAAVASADKYFQEAKYETAKEAYSNALSIKPSETYPATKISEIEAKLENIAAEEAAAKAEAERLAKIEADYNAAISKADKAFGEKTWETATASYNEALSVKPGEKYPLGKIAEIKKLKEEELAQKQQQEIENSYQAAISKADKAFAEKSWETATASYNEALSVKPGEKYPTDKIAEIKKRREEELAKMEQKQIDASYQAAIAKADKAFAEADYETAKASYSNAQEIKAGEEYPKQKIQEIAELQKQLALAAKSKAAEELQSKYQAAVQEGDQFLASGNFTSAKKAYSQALSIKPEEQYPVAQLAVIEEKLKLAAEQSAAEQLAKEKAAKLETNYLSAIALADQALENKDYSSAKTNYKQALAFKPSEEYPQQRINEIDALLAKKEEKNAEKEALAEEKRKVDAEYNSYVIAGEKELKAENLQSALSAFQSASKVKPAESYPQEKIAEINGLLAQKAAAKEAEKEQQQMLAKQQMEYLAIITDADQLFENKEWENARSKYKSALSIKPSEEYPQQRVNEINALLAKSAEKEALAEEKKKLDAEYNAFILSGEKGLNAENMQAALTAFQSAAKLKPTESYPQEKITEITGFLAQQSASKEAEKKQQQLKAQQQMDYLAAITDADKLFEDKKWESARAKYKSALSIKPSETYPQQRIQEIDSALEKEKQLAEAAAAVPEKTEKKVEEKKVEEKIVVDRGPVSKISGETEDKIDQMYQEIWEENETGKESYFAKQKDLVDANSEELRLKEEERKKNAIERLEDIHISYSESMKQSNRLNKQNYESVKNNQEQYQEREKELNIKGQRMREEHWRVQQELQEEVQKTRTATAERNTGTYTDQLKDREENHKNNLASYESQQKRTREEKRSEQLEIAKGIEERSLASESKTAAHAQDLVALKEAHVENMLKYQENQEKIREERNKEYVSNAQEWQDYQAHLAEKTERENKNHLEDVKQYHQEYSKIYIDNQKEATSEIDQLLKNQQEFILAENRAQEEKTTMKAELLAERKQELSQMEAERLSASGERNHRNLETEYYTGAAKLRNDSLASRYPQGISEEIIEGKNGSTTIRRIVVTGTQADVYTKTLHAWGGVFYTKNGRNITEVTWNQETD